MHRENNGELFLPCGVILCNIKHIFQALLFNVRKYLPEVINIQRREAELNNILPRRNNFGITQKRNVLFQYMSPTPNKSWEDKG